MSADIETLLREADPVKTGCLTIEGEAVLLDILASPVDSPEGARVTKSTVRRPKRGKRPAFRTPRVAWAAAAVVAVLVGALLFGIPWMTTPPAAAGIAPALVATPNGQTRAEAISGLLAKARSIQDPPGFDPQAYRLKFIHESFLPAHSGVSEPANSFSPVSEFDRVATRLDNGDYEYRTTSRGLFSARTGQRLPDYDPLTRKKIPLGQQTVEVHEAFSPDQVPEQAPAIDKMTRQLSAEALAMYTGDQQAALFEVLGMLMNDWNPSQTQSAGVLELLEKRPDVRFDGKTTDRMGRAGLMFSIDGSYAPGEEQGDRYSYQYSFIFDATTGHLNAYEEVAGKDIDYFVPGGTLHSVTVAAP